MIAILVFLVALGILLAEGCMLAMLVLGYKTSRWVRCPFALPLAAISNVLLILFYTIFGILLTVLSLLIGHLLLIAIIGLCVWKWRRHSHIKSSDIPKSPHSKTFFA